MTDSDPLRPPARLEGDRVALRRLGGEDVPRLYEIFSDPEVSRYWSSGPLESPAGAQLLLEEIDSLWEEGTLFQWGIARVPEDDVVGTCTLFQVDREHGRGEVGYALAYRFWGRGYATEALSLLLGYVFHDLGLHRLEADVDPRNAPSIRLLERLGFRREGVLRERWRVNDEWQDGALYGLLRSEWPAAGKEGSG